MSDVSPAAARPSGAYAPPKLGQGVRKDGFRWVYAIAIWSFHGLACLALLPWLFTWTGVVVMIAGVFLFGQGINLGYHRLLAHRSLRVPRWLEYALVCIALCCLQDTPMRWVTHHRCHHRYADMRKDVHSPLINLYWSHMGWLFWKNRDVQTVGAYNTYARDLLGDPFYRALERSNWLSFGCYLAHAGLFFLSGLAIGWIGAGEPMGGLRLGLSLLVWGVLVRTVVVWHITWSVNSLGHRFGYRSYPTKDVSRNNWLVGYVAAGEGWHNNHHWNPGSARHGHRWWELDLTWAVVWVIERLGLATNVVRPRRPRRRAQSSLAASSTSSTWPGTLTLRQTPRTVPAPSIR